MAIKPILFNTEMVRANLDGKKSCTRRIVKPQPTNEIQCPLGICTDGDKSEIGKFAFGSHEGGGKMIFCKPPYQPGDILYVRETWKKALNGYYYYEDWQRNDIADVTKWKPSIRMPKEAARIWLKVTDVRVERLQEMTLKDFKAEGIYDNYKTYSETYTDHLRQMTYPKVFARLWNSTIKKSDLDRYGWDANPWVWVIEFERCEKPEEISG